MLSREEIAHATELKDPVVDKLLALHDAVTNDPTDELDVALRLVIKKINADLFTIHGNENGQYNELELNILNREDKLFERVLLLFKENEKIRSSMSRGREEKSALPKDNSSLIF